MRKVSTYKMAFTLLAATSLLAGCSGDDFNGNGNVNGNSNNITFNTNVNNFISKAATYDNNAALKAEGSFTCTAYNATTTTAFIEPTQVEWTGSKWQFAQDQYWPGASGLDFFAYMPATKPDYITSISYSTARQPQFVCTDLPTTAEGQKDLKEFVCAMETDKTQANSSEGVRMQFKHTFAKLLFKLDPASGSNVKINSVRIDGIKMSGTCSFDGTTSTWIPSGDDTYVMATAIDGTTPYLVIPNTYAIGAVTITVNATWTSISGVTTNKTATNKAALTWNPGYSYLFTLTLSGDALVVNTEKWAEQM